MICKYCGREYSSLAGTCDACAALQAQRERTSHALYGAHGWLLFFICILVFLSPAYYLYTASQRTPRALEVYSHVEHKYSAIALLVTQVCVQTALVAYGIYAGIQLWRLRQGAARRAKKYLVLIFLFRVAFYVSWLIWAVLMSSEALRATRVSRYAWGATAKDVLLSLIPLAVWYAYLTTSKRVRATFGDQG